MNLDERENSEEEGLEQEVPLDLTSHDPGRYEGPLDLRRDVPPQPVSDYGPINYAWVRPHRRLPRVERQVYGDPVFSVPKTKVKKTHDKAVQAAVPAKADNFNGYNVNPSLATLPASHRQVVEEGVGDNFQNAAVPARADIVDKENVHHTPATFPALHVQVVQEKVGDNLQSAAVPARADIIGEDDVHPTPATLLTSEVQVVPEGVWDKLRSAARPAKEAVDGDAVTPTSTNLPATHVQVVQEGVWDNVQSAAVPAKADCVGKDEVYPTPATLLTSEVQVVQEGVGENSPVSLSQEDVSEGDVNSSSSANGHVTVPVNFATSQGLELVFEDEEGLELHAALLEHVDVTEDYTHYLFAPTYPTVPGNKATLPQEEDGGHEVSAAFPKQNEENGETHFTTAQVTVPVIGPTTRKIEGEVLGVPLEDAELPAEVNVQNYDDPATISENVAALSNETTKEDPQEDEKDMRCAGLPAGEIGIGEAENSLPAPFASDTERLVPQGGGVNKEEDFSKNYDDDTDVCLSEDDENDSSNVAQIPRKPMQVDFTEEETPEERALREVVEELEGINQPVSGEISEREVVKSQGLITHVHAQDVQVSPKVAKSPQHALKPVSKENPETKEKKTVLTKAQVKYYADTCHFRHLFEEKNLQLDLIPEHLQRPTLVQTKFDLSKKEEKKTLTKDRFGNIRANAERFFQKYRSQKLNLAKENLPSNLPTKDQRKSAADRKQEDALRESDAIPTDLPCKIQLVRRVSGWRSVPKSEFHMPKIGSSISSPTVVVESEILELEPVRREESRTNAVFIGIRDHGEEKKKKKDRGTAVATRKINKKSGVDREMSPPALDTPIAHKLPLRRSNRIRVRGSTPSSSKKKEFCLRTMPQIAQNKAAVARVVPIVLEHPVSNRTFSAKPLQGHEQQEIPEHAAETDPQKPNYNTQSPEKTPMPKSTAHAATQLPNTATTSNSKVKNPAKRGTAFAPRAPPTQDVQISPPELVTVPSRITDFASEPLAASENSAESSQTTPSYTSLAISNRLKIKASKTKNNKNSRIRKRKWVEIEENVKIEEEEKVEKEEKEEEEEEEKEEQEKEEEEEKVECNLPSSSKGKATKKTKSRLMKRRGNATKDLGKTPSTAIVKRGRKRNAVNSFQCPHCPKTCNRRDNLNRHILNYHAEKKTWHVCDYCGHKNGRDDLMKTHVLKCKKRKESDPISWTSFVT